MNDRIEKLRSMMLDVEHRHYRVRKHMSILDDDTASLPVVERKALGFVKMLDEMPKFIMDGELIVGSRTLFNPRHTEGTDGLSKNLDFAPDAETLAVESPGFEFYPHYLTDAEQAKGAALGIGEGYVTSHCAPGFDRVLTKGFGGLRNEANASLANHGKNSPQAPFLNAVIMILDAIEQFIGSYAELAESMAGSCKDSIRRDELQTISEICSRIKTKPATTFHEALQTVWFVHTFMLMENYNLMSLGRPDQYLYSYYLSDIDAEILTPDQARELLGCLFIKLNDTSDLHTDNGLNIITSGLKPDGTDGTNELSWLFIETYEDVKLTDPQLNIRWHRDTPKDFMKRVMKIKGRFPIPPMVFNDEILIPGLTDIGASLEDARNYSIDACQDVLIPGKSDFYPIFAGTYGIHLLTVFDRVLPRLTQCESFDEFYQQLFDEFTADVEKVVETTNKIDALLPEISPTPVLSLMLEGCIEKGLDKTEGGTIYNHTGFIGGGLVNIADSLAAIKKLVFDEKIVSPKELLSAINANFSGYESLQAKLKNDAPKWGNGDMTVDTYGIELARHFSEEVLKYENVRGGRFVPGLMTHHQVRLGNVVPATPDGRKQGEPLAVSLSPSIGQMKKGPTGALNSAMAVNHRLCPVGTSVDLTLQNSLFKSDEDLDKVITMTEAFLEGGGMEIQYNILDPDMLRAAQKTPNQYRDLVLRVWGFNAYFVTLQREYQDELIARAETGVK
ncbi:MAG: pyruvate formate lyase family protein [Desulfocapsaceae bacterium]